MENLEVLKLAVVFTYFLLEVPPEVHCSRRPSGKTERIPSAFSAYIPKEATSAKKRCHGSQLEPQPLRPRPQSEDQWVHIRCVCHFGAPGPVQVDTGSGRSCLCCNETQIEERSNESTILMMMMIIYDSNDVIKLIVVDIVVVVIVILIIIIIIIIIIMDKKRKQTPSTIPWSPWIARHCEGGNTTSAKQG